MQQRTALVGASLLAGLLTAGSAAAWLSEYGIEGMHVVSTKAVEVRASVSPDGQRIVWGSTDREGGRGGWDLWQARLVDGRWQDPQPLALNSRDNDFDPMFSTDGRWLYFFSNRRGGEGGDDLYRAAVEPGGFGKPANLGPGVNTAGDEWAPTPSADGAHLLFASDGHGGAGGHDLFVARHDGDAFVDPRPLAGVNTAADEFDGAWLGAGRSLVFARSDDPATAPVRLHVAHCDGSRYGREAPLKLSFNTAEATTLGPVVDWNKPGELLVTGVARAPRAGGLDIYRMKAPAADGEAGCVAQPSSRSQPAASSA
ncbi:TolB family protein [Novilysobacter arseniciresistens]|uniref:TolB family protein n=1 Tax=Novilysobacter arseniciresistens TaxID=1385522 RepID=UPI00068AD42A|nr:PD40 domain-containing protein [Lysobacter arseniciresistens]